MRRPAVQRGEQRTETADECRKASDGQVVNCVTDFGTHCSDVCSDFGTHRNEIGLGQCQSIAHATNINHQFCLYNGGMLP